MSIPILAFECDDIAIKEKAMPTDTGYEFHRLGEIPLIFHRNSKNEGLAAAPNWHENPEFLYITEGEASVLCGDASVTAKAGELVCIGAYRAHTVRATPSVCYHCLIVDADFCRESGIEPLELELPTVVKNEKIASLFLAIDASLLSGDAYRIPRVRGAVLAFLAELAASHACTPKKQENVGAVRTVYLTVGYMRAHMAEEISLDDLARESGLSRFYFARLFRSVTGISPLVYLTLLRLEHAQRLLDGGALPIAEIAASCGLGSPSYFARTFKKYCGMLPSEYRRSH